MNKKVWTIVGILIVFIVGGTLFLKPKENKKEEASNADIKITHKLGEATLKKNPKKIVVFDYGTLDSLDKMGIEIKGLPKSNIPSYLSKYKDDKYVDVGTLFETNFEKLNEIKPDVVFISARQSKVYEELNKIAPTIQLNTENGKYMESVKSNLEKLGKVFDKEDFVKDEIKKLDDSVKYINKKASESGKKALVILANDGALSAYGKGSRFGLIHEELGFPLSDEHIDTAVHGQKISFEYVVEKNPDYIFVVDRGAVVQGGHKSVNKILENDLIKTTKAYKNNKIISLNPELWYISSGGIVSTTEMLKEIKDSIK
ncbi:siderophore ABC transporter substrate-binding protein [Clostridium botulinum]|uniref:siderophore ABC transporter substrate-binding protein n=1 Tax=Clostridium botulinum TaxID=1491 RepID=UPI00016BAD28|nr:siderophore ABC transporter substrate-binding protein [Clostridium botulinum]EDT86029.1 iron chelate uptake ABC transporter, FeCT family, solute-binding protein [Clostridium botulinum Bf]